QADGRGRGPEAGQSRRGLRERPPGRGSPERGEVFRIGRIEGNVREFHGVVPQYEWVEDVPLNSVVVLTYTCIVCMMVSYDVTAYLRGDAVHRRINITLSEDTLALLDRVASKGDRSRLIDEAVRLIPPSAPKFSAPGQRSSCRTTLPIATARLPLSRP